MAALMETAPSSGERTELSEPIIPPIGVRAEPAITMSLFMDFVLLQQNLVCILVLPIGLVWASGPLVWAPSLPVVGGGYAGCGVFFFWEKQLASLRHLFPCQKNTPHPPTDGQHRNAEYKKQKAKSKKQKAKSKKQKATRVT